MLHFLHYWCVWIRQRQTGSLHNCVVCVCKFLCLRMCGLPVQHLCMTALPYYSNITAFSVGLLQLCLEQWKTATGNGLLNASVHQCKLSCTSLNCCNTKLLVFLSRVWSVRYNHSHDQLVLTASSDSRLILSNMVSISSEPFGHLVDDEELSEGEDNHHEGK